MDLSNANVSGTSGASDDKIDALRHGIWCALTGKYACYRYGTVLEAGSVARGFVDSHECGQNSVSSAMDDHNNTMSYIYYIDNSERYKYGFLDYDVRMNKTDQEIVNDINNKGYIQVISDINTIKYTNFSKLVHLN